MDKSKGTLEAEISIALTHWEKNYLGRGSISVKSDILRDMVIVTLHRILTPAEYSLCRDKEGLLSIKKNRNSLVESGQDDLKEIFLTITNQEVVSFHTDISTNTGERVMFFKLSNDLEKNFKCTPQDVSLVKKKQNFLFSTTIKKRENGLKKNMVIVSY